MNQDSYLQLYKNMIIGARSIISSSRRADKELEAGGTDGSGSASA